MHTQNNIEERLWNFIDGTVSTEEKTAITELLESNAEWKEKYQDLLQVNKLLQSSELESPSLRFSKNVMEEIARIHITPATKSYINNKIIWSIGFFFIAMLVAFLIYGFAQMDFTSGEETTLSKNLSKIDLSKFFNNSWINAFMMVNVVIGLVLFDNFLSNKKNQFRKQI